MHVITSLRKREEKSNIGERISPDDHARLSDYFRKSSKPGQQFTDLCYFRRMRHYLTLCLLQLSRKINLKRTNDTPINTANAEHKHVNYGQGGSNWLQDQLIIRLKGHDVFYNLHVLQISALKMFFLTQNDKFSNFR